MTKWAREDLQRDGLEVRHAVTLLGGRPDVSNEEFSAVVEEIKLGVTTISLLAGRGKTRAVVSIYRDVELLPQWKQRQGAVDEARKKMGYL